MSRSRGPPAVKKLQLYRNGDPLFKAINFTYNSKRCPSFDAFLSECDTRVGTRKKQPVHNLYANDGQKLISLHEVLSTKDGVVVVAGKEPFKEVHGGYENIGKMKAIKVKGKDKLSVGKPSDGGSRRGSRRSSRSRSRSAEPGVGREGSYMALNKQTHNDVQSKHLQTNVQFRRFYLLKAGDPDFPPKRYNWRSRQTRTFEALLKDIADTLGERDIGYLHTQDGEPITKLDELQNEQAYVASAEEGFVDLRTQLETRGGKGRTRTALPSPRPPPRERSSSHLPGNHQKIMNRRDQIKPDSTNIYVFLNGKGFKGQRFTFSEKQLDKGMPWLLEQLSKAYVVYGTKLATMDGEIIKSVNNLEKNGAYVLITHGEKKFKDCWYFLPEGFLDTTSEARAEREAQNSPIHTPRDHGEREPTRDGGHSAGQPYNKYDERATAHSRRRSVPDTRQTARNNDELGIGTYEREQADDDPYDKHDDKHDDKYDKHDDKHDDKYDKHDDKHHDKYDKHDDKYDKHDDRDDKYDRQERDDRHDRYEVDDREDYGRPASNDDDNRPYNAYDNEAERHRTDSRDSRTEYEQHYDDEDDNSTTGNFSLIKANTTVDDDTFETTTIAGAVVEPTKWPRPYIQPAGKKEGDRRSKRSSRDRYDDEEEGGRYVRAATSYDDRYYEEFDDDEFAYKNVVDDEEGRVRRAKSASNLTRSTGGRSTRRPRASGGGRGSDDSLNSQADKRRNDKRNANNNSAPAATASAGKERGSRARPTSGHKKRDSPGRARHHRDNSRPDTMDSVSGDHGRPASRYKDDRYRRTDTTNGRRSRDRTDGRDSRDGDGGRDSRDRDFERERRPDTKPERRASRRRPSREGQRR